MRSKFIGRFPLTPEEHEQIWSESTIILDTNALLNLYRYSADARQNLLNNLSHIRQRIWLPHQVASEFHMHRVDLIRKQQKVADELTALIETLSSQAIAKLKEHTKNAFFEISELQSSIESNLASTKADITERFQRGIAQYGITPQDDPVLLKIGELYDGRVGSPYTDEQLTNLIPVADERYANEVPPGYKDAGKSGNKKYGDYLLWRQIIDYAKQQQCNVILVTDENKEDWWWKSEGEILGPRPELREEFAQEVGKIFYLYKPAKFLAELGSRTQVVVPERVVTELSNTSEELADEERRSRGRAIERRASKLGDDNNSLFALREYMKRINSAINHAVPHVEEVQLRLVQAYKLREDLTLETDRIESLLEKGEISVTERNRNRMNLIARSAQASYNIDELKLEYESAMDRLRQLQARFRSARERMEVAEQIGFAQNPVSDHTEDID